MAETYKLTACEPRTAEYLAKKYTISKYDDMIRLTAGMVSLSESLMNCVDRDEINTITLQLLSMNVNIIHYFQSDRYWSTAEKAPLDQCRKNLYTIGLSDSIVEPKPIRFWFYKSTSSPRSYVQANCKTVRNLIVQEPLCGKVSDFDEYTFKTKPRLITHYCWQNRTCLGVILPFDIAPKPTKT